MKMNFNFYLFEDNQAKMNRKLRGKSGIERTKIVDISCDNNSKNDKIMYKDAKGLN